MRGESPTGKKHQDKTGRLKSFGFGLTKLRKFAKTIGRDSKLARQLWKSNIYEMKIISLLIDDPNSMTIEQAETQSTDVLMSCETHALSGRQL